MGFQNLIHYHRTNFGEFIPSNRKTIKENGEFHIGECLSPLREEVLNVKLAELLSRSGLLSVPERALVQ